MTRRGLLKTSSHPLKVQKEISKTDEQREELPDNWWYRVYLAVIITTIFVIAALWAFSRYFS